MVYIPTVDPVPNTTPPGIEIISPQNDSAYPSSGVISLIFNVSKPELAAALKTGVTRVYYILDNQPAGVPTEVYSIYTANDNAPGRQNVTYTSNLTLPLGNHRLTIYADGVVYPTDRSIFGTSSNSYVIFTVASPSTPAPPTTENNSLSILYSIETIAAIIIIVSVVLVIKKRKMRKS